jgi:hypothetical protein
LKAISFAVGSSVLARIVICFDGHTNVPASAIERVGQYLLSYGYGRHFLPKEEKRLTNYAVKEGTPSISGRFEAAEDGQPAQENHMYASHKPPSKTVFSPADLRDETYDGMHEGKLPFSDYARSLLYELGLEQLPRGVSQCTR